MFLTSVVGEVNLNKSKLCPKVKGIPVVIDITKSGRIDEVKSFMELLIRPDMGVIPQGGGWYNMEDLTKILYKNHPDTKGKFKQYEKKYRYNDLVEDVRKDKALLDSLKLLFMDKILTIFPAQREVMEEYYNKTLKEIN